MAKITVGSRTLTIPPARVAKAAEYIRKWYNLEGDTPAEILDAWSDHIIEEVKRYLVKQFRQDAHSDSMEGSGDTADAAGDAAAASADGDLVLE